MASPRTRDVSVCDCSRRAGFGVSYAAAGRRAGALKDLDQLNELSKKKFVSAKALARIYAALGEKDKAFKWLEKSYDERSIGTGFGSLRPNLRSAELRPALPGPAAPYESSALARAKKAILSDANYGNEFQ